MVQYADQLDLVLGAISDPTRRAVLERLRDGDAGISELAEPFGISLTGMKKHVGVLEEAGLVATEKVGRTRVCRLGPRDLSDVGTWIDHHRRTLEARLDRLGAMLEEEGGRRCPLRPPSTP